MTIGRPLAVAFAFALLSSTASGFDRAAFERSTQALFDRSGVPGMAVALVEAGEVVWARGFGVADRARGEPVTPDTVFQAASISKPVAAWVFLALVEAGRLELDAPAGAHLKRWRLPAGGFDSRGVTLRRILSHTAGLSVPGYLGFPPGTVRQSLEASLTAAEDAGGQGLAVIYPPGRAWHYSGGGYTLAQLLAEEASGVRFAALAQATVLRPLGMRASTFEQPDGLRAGMALSYDERGAPVLDRRFTAEAAAGLRSTAKDLARFAAALMNGPAGEPPGRGVLAARTVASMLAPQPASSSDDILRGSEWGLGFGLKRVTPGRQLLVYHPGDNIPGFHNVLAAIPERRIAVVALTNGAAGRALRTAVLCEWLRGHGAAGVAECDAASRAAGPLPGLGRRAAGDGRAGALA